MGAQKSRIAKAGGDVALARQQFEQEIAAGRANLSSAQRALLQRDPEAFFAKYLNQSTKGKYSGVLGGVAKVAKTIAPIGAAFIPGIGPIAAGAIAAGTKAAGSALAGEKINPLDVALTGAGVAGGKYLSGRSPIGTGGKELAGLSKVGPGVASGGGGFSLGGLGGQALDWITSDPERALRLGLGTVGAIQGAQQAGRANALQERALAPLFNGSVNPYDQLPDYGNPYSSQYRRPQGQASLSAMLGR